MMIFFAQLAELVGARLNPFTHSTPSTPVAPFALSPARLARYSYLYSNQSPLFTPFPTLSASFVVMNAHTGPDNDHLVSFYA